MNRNLDDTNYKMLGLFSTWRLLFKILFKQKGERMSPRDHIHVKCVSARDLKLTFSGDAFSDDKFSISDVVIFYP